MDVVSAQVSADLFWPIWALGVGLFWMVLRRVQWHMLATADNLNVYLGACVVVMGFWLMKAGVKPGLSLHLLGATILTLMFRPWFALLASALITSSLALWQDRAAAIALDWLLLGVVPVMVTWTIHSFGRRVLPRNFFVYVFVSAFLAGGASMVATGLATTAFHAASGTFRLDYLLDHYLSYFILIGWSEALITGMVMTVLVLWKPQWVGSFLDRDYSIAPVADSEEEREDPSASTAPGRVVNESESA